MFLATRSSLFTRDRFANFETDFAVVHEQFRRSGVEIIAKEKQREGAHEALGAFYPKGEGASSRNVRGDPRRDAPQKGGRHELRNF
jgi:hypothetical protein